MINKQQKRLSVKKFKGLTIQSRLASSKADKGLKYYFCKMLYMIVIPSKKEIYFLVEHLPNATQKFDDLETAIGAYNKIK